MSSYFFIRASDDVAPEVKETDRFDGVVLETEKLTHPTANRAKPPQRRPPSGLITAIQVNELFLRFLRFSYPNSVHDICNMCLPGNCFRFGYSSLKLPTWHLVCVWQCKRSDIFPCFFFFQISTIIKDHTGGMVTLRQPLLWVYIEF